MSCDIVTKSPLGQTKSFNTEVNDKEHIDSTDVLDLCDASTVFNVSLVKKEKKKIVRKYKHGPENELLDNGITSNEIPVTQVELTQERTDQPVDRLVKVVSWLEHSLIESHEESDSIEETECFITDNWLDKNPTNPTFTKNIRRVKVLLLEVEPSPDNEPLDLVSGYCLNGCKRFSTYSDIAWLQEDSYDIPFCPICGETDSEKELKLMFKFKLRVMDPNGIHVDLNVWKEHAEQFFGCSAEDFIRNPLIREAVILPLRRYTVANTMYEDSTPLLDVNLICIKDFFFVVNSSLKGTKKSIKEHYVTVLSESKKMNKSTAVMSESTEMN